jgi:hypothetical protein
MNLSHEALMRRRALTAAWQRANIERQRTYEHDYRERNRSEINRRRAVRRALSKTLNAVLLAPVVGDD